MIINCQNDEFINELAEDVKQKFSTILLCHADSLPEQLPNQCIVVSNALEPNQVVENLIDKKAAHIVQKNKNHYSEDILIAGNLILDPASYFNSLGSSLVSDPMKELKLEFSGPKDKSTLKSRVFDFLGEVVNQNVTESVEAIFEEMYMNAIIDAPKEAARNGHAVSSYDDGRKSSLHLLMTENKFVITCEDPFGSLLVEKFLLRMKEVYATGAGAAINFREGGAGLGCVIMFEHCSHLFLGVIPGQKTVVSCIVPTGLSYRQRANIKKSLHLIKV